MRNSLPKNLSKIKSLEWNIKATLQAKTIRI
jgi:hypothetical protein